MLPNSAGSVLAILAALMGGRVPVMINYSTGAAANCEYAQKKCAFKTIITSRALCQKINCPHVEGMIYLEDVMKTVSVFDKVKAALKAGQSAERLLKSIHQRRRERHPAHPVHQRQRKGSQGRAADPPQHQRQLSRA